MTDIERRLRDLGERAREEQGPGALPPNTVRAAKRRRLGTGLTTLTVVAALAYGGTFAAGALVATPEIVPPAGPASRSESVRLQAAFPGQGRASAIIHVNRGMVCFGMTDLRTENSLYTSIQILLGQNAERPVVLTPPPGDQAERPCVGNLDVSLLEAIISDPGRYYLEIKVPTSQFAGEETLIASLAIPAGDECARIGFEPTYLPPGWIPELQEGSGGGAAWDVVGHYGNEAVPSSTDKADEGFAELFAKESPYPLQSGEAMRVLGKQARFGAIHEGFAVEFEHRGCAYALIGYVDGEELRRFADGLRLEERGEDPPSRESFGAIWPEDIEERAGEECTSVQHVDDHWRLDPIRTAERFATDVLGWAEVQARQSKPDEGGVGVYVGNGPISSESPVVAVYVGQLAGCWSVISVSRVPDGEPTGVSVSVRGREAQIGFDTLDATAGTVEVGYGFRVKTKRWVAAEADEGPVTFELDFDPDTTGHFLILFEDQDGNVFSASGGPLPEGDFSAG